MHVTTSSEQNIVWWELNENSTPTDENLFLEVLKKCTGEEVSAEELKRKSIHIIQTKAPESKVGKEAKALQNRLYAKFPHIFGQVTVIVGSEQRHIPRGYLETLDPHFANSFSHAMIEERTNTIQIAMPDGVDCEKAAIAFIDKGEAAIDAENALPLLQLALFAKISLLEEAVTRYLIHNWEIGDDFEGAKDFLEFIITHQDTLNLTALKIFIYEYVCNSVNKSPSFLDFIKTLDPNHPMKWMSDFSHRVILGKKEVFISGYHDLSKVAYFVGTSTEKLTIKYNSQIISGSFSTLTSLTLSECQSLTNEHVAALGSHCQKSLKELIIRDCPAICSLEKNSYSELDTIDASNSSFTTEALVSLSNACPRLKTLILNGSERIKSFAGATFSQLEKLDIRNCPCSLEDLPRNLKDLSIGRKEHTQKLPISLPASLETLYLYNIKLTAADCLLLTKQCKHIKTLILEECTLEGEAPEEFVLLSLEELTLTKCTFSYAMDWFTAICDVSRGNIKKLTLTCIDFHNDEAYPGLSTVNLAELCELRIKNCKDEECACRYSLVRDQFYFEEIEAPNLSLLEIENTRLSQDDLHALSATAGKSLKNLVLRNTKLTNLNEFAFSALESLEVRKATIIDEDLKTISRVSKESLKSLYLSQCFGITTFEGTVFPSVYDLSVKQTNLLQKGYESIDAAFPNLQKKEIKNNRFRLG